MPRFFTLGQVREVLPRVKKLMTQAVDGKEKYQDADQRTQDFIRRVMMMGGMVVDRKVFLLNRDSQHRSGERLKIAVEEIQKIGAVIKDLDQGLVDFPTMLHGSEVYICWRISEDDVQYWHGVDEGFAGRKIIDRDFLDNHGAKDLD